MCVCGASFFCVSIYKSSQKRLRKNPDASELVMRSCHRKVHHQGPMIRERRLSILRRPDARYSHNWKIQKLG